GPSTSGGSWIVSPSAIRIPSPKMIKLSSVRKKFATTVALHETDLCISGGKTTVLIGPSGCGKSTILRLIVGLLEPTTGTIEIDGDRVSPANILALRRRI